MRSILGERAKIVLFFSKIIMPMKNIIIFIFCALISMFAHSQNADGIWAFNELRKNSLNEYTVISEYQRLPQSFSVVTDLGSMSSYKTFTEFDFFHSSEKIELLGEVPIAVHEVNHGLTNGKAYTECNRRGLPGLKNNYYFVTPAGNEILVRSNLRFFPTGLIIPLIPKDKRSFRFDTYVEGNTSTQTDGLLGLLDEFNSYAHSLATVYMLKKSYMEIPGTELSHYISWRQDMHSYVQSYYEFKYFVLQYLLYAKTNERALYAEIKNSPDLMLAISTINSDFLSIINLFNEEDQVAGPAYWKKKGYSVLKDPATGYENYKQGGSTIGYGCKMEDRDKLLPEINSSKFNEIKADFSIR
jgi:hypothetical protein